MRLLLILVANALALLVMAKVVPGIEIESFLTAVLAAVVLGVFNTFLRPILEFLALPVTFVTLGLFSWVISALVLWLTSVFVPGFEVAGFLPALVGGVILAFVASFFQLVAKRIV